MDKIADPNIAATCERTKQEISSPKDDEAVTIRSAPKNIAQKEPFIGTSRTKTAHATIPKKLIIDRTMYGSCLPIRNWYPFAGEV